MSAQENAAQEVGARQKQAILKLVAELEPQVEAAIPPELAQRLSKLYMTGCGDSFFAANAVRHFFERHVRLPVEPIESMEFSRYAVDAMPADALVVGISYGGKVSRTIEAVARARRRGAYTIAATGFGERAAAREAHVAVVGGLPGIRQVVDRLDAALADKKLSRAELLGELSKPGAAQRLAETLGIHGGMHLALVGMGAFLTSALALYLIGLRLGTLRGRLSAGQAAALKQEMLSFADIQTHSIERNLETSRQLAQAFKGLHHFTFLGSGPSFAAAQFSAAKLFEQPHLNGVAQYIEEWAHLQLFYTRPQTTVVFFIVPPGRSRDRAMEQMLGAKALGATVVAICDSEDQELAGLADWVAPICGNLCEEFSPLAYIVPGQLFAFASLELRGQPPIPPPYSFQQMMEVNYKLIYASPIRTED